jgi:hypothetical protein
LRGGGGPQYLRVLLKRGMSLDRRVVVLAHELQHAREVWKPVSWSDVPCRLSILGSPRVRLVGRQPRQSMLIRGRRRTRRSGLTDHRSSSSTTIRPTDSPPQQRR